MMKQVKLLFPALFFLSLNLVIAVLADSCPAKEDVYPCTCSEEKNILEVNCWKGSAEEFQKSFNHLRGKKVNVNIDCTLSSEPCTIKAEMFWDLKLQRLELKKVELQGTLDAKSRETMSKITELHIARSTRLARELPNWGLDGMKHLEKLSLWFNNMTEISNKMFRTGPKSLTRLSIIDNEFQTIGDEAFASLSNLVYLWIEKGGIKNIERSMLPKEAPHLFNLDFRENKLLSLPENIFDNMPSLTQVELGGNYISQLPAAPWSKVWEQLRKLDLKNNPLVCDSHMKWMFTKSRPKELEAKCRHPEKMNGKDLSSFVDENS